MMLRGMKALIREKQCEQDDLFHGMTFEQIDDRKLDNDKYHERFAVNSWFRLSKDRERPKQ